MTTKTEPPDRVYVQIVGSIIAAYDTDPREVHDNGKPVYEYARVRTPASVGEAAEKATRVIANTLTPTQFGDYRMLLQFEARGQQAFIPETCKEVRRIEVIVADIIASEFAPLSGRVEAMLEKVREYQEHWITKLAEGSQSQQYYIRRDAASEILAALTAITNADGEKSFDPLNPKQ